MSETTIVTLPCPDCGHRNTVEMRAASTFVRADCQGCENPVVGRRDGGDDDA